MMRPFGRLPAESCGARRGLRGWFLGQSSIMGTVEEHEKRSQDLADTTRRIVVTLNGGGVGVVFSVAGTLAARGVPANWAIWPVALFVSGLLFTGVSLFLAKHRELNRRDAAKAKEDEPEKFHRWYWRSFTWDLVAFALSGIGAVAGLVALSCVAHGR